MHIGGNHGADYIRRDLRNKRKGTPDRQMKPDSGIVIVQAYFDADGNITVLKVVKGLGYGLDENALRPSADGALHQPCAMGCPSVWWRRSKCISGWL